MKQLDLFPMELKQALHRGVDSERLNNPHNDLELIFAEEWAKNNISNNSNGLLADLYLTHNRKDLEKRFPTNEEYIAAATAIQWLGTNCGYSFLIRVLRKDGSYISKIFKEKLKENIDITDFLEIL